MLNPFSSALLGMRQVVISSTPNYNKDLHPVEEWNWWYYKNRIEIENLPQYSKQEVYDLVVENRNNYREKLADEITYKEEAERLCSLRYVQTYKYETESGVHLTWSPLLTFLEWSDLCSQVVQFNEDNRGFRDLRPRHPNISKYYKANDFITPIFTSNPFAANTNEVDYTQEAPTIQSPNINEPPKRTSQSPVPQELEDLNSHMRDMMWFDRSNM